MKGSRILVAAAAVTAVTVAIGCGSTSDESAPSEAGSASIEQSATAKPLDGAQAALESEGMAVERPGAGQINTDELDVKGGGALGDAIFTVLYYDDKNKALTEKDSIDQVFTGKFADRGIIEASPDQLVLYEVTREGKALTEAQIAEFERLRDLVEASR